MSDFTWKEFCLSEILLGICVINVPDFENPGKWFIVFISQFHYT